MSTFGIVLLFVAGLMLLLQIWRLWDDRRASGAWEKIASREERADSVFDLSMVKDLPEPARRYFEFMIQPGTPLRTVVEIRMSGEIGLGTRQSPNYLPMRAKQVLAPPHGLVWIFDAGRGFVRVAGSDGFDGETSWVRFWLLKTFPVVRAGGSPDHVRAALGRVIAESVFWVPAALLPANGITWTAVGKDVARATVTYRDLSQTVDVTVAGDGRPTMVVIPRWSNANPQKTYQVQPFGGYLSAFRKVDGYRLPVCVEGGNFIGTDDYFPFYKARVDNFQFVGDD